MTRQRKFTQECSAIILLAEPEIEFDVRGKSEHKVIISFDWRKLISNSSHKFWIKIREFLG